MLVERRYHELPAIAEDHPHVVEGTALLLFTVVEAGLPGFGITPVPENETTSEQAAPHDRHCEIMMKAATLLGGVYDFASTATIIKGIQHGAISTAHVDGPS